MNKRGDIPIGTVVLVALVFSITALGIFYLSDRSFAGRSGDWSSLMAEAAFAEFYTEKVALTILDESLSSNETGTVRDKFRKIAIKHNIKYAAASGFFDSVAAGKFNITQQGNIHMLEMNDVVVVSSRGNDRIARVFDLKVDATEG